MDFSGVAPTIIIALATLILTALGMRHKTDNEYRDSLEDKLDRLMAENKKLEQELVLSEERATKLLFENFELRRKLDRITPSA